MVGLVFQGLSSTPDLGCKTGMGMCPKPREPLPCKAQYEAGTWHRYSALQVSPLPSQPWQP